MAEQRVQKVLADQGICSRREAERLIAAGKVKVNGHPVGLGDKMDPDYDKVSIDGQTVRIVRKRQYTYIMLHKPRGFLTTRSDDRGRKTVMDLVSDVPAMLRPVGRLDKDSEGLLLMTDDGAFINLLTHPSGGVGKLYRVTVNPRATEEQIIQMSSGVVLDDGVKTQPCVIHVVVDEPGRTVLEITLHEGRNRQIRRMCSAVGLQVVRLRRTAEGPVKLLTDLLAKVDGTTHFVYWQVTRGVETRNHVYAEDLPGKLWVSIRPNRLNDPDVPIKLDTAEDTRFYHCNIKTLNLLPSVVAAQHAKRIGVQETVFHRGDIVTECAHSNVSILKDGVFYSHPNDEFILRGIAKTHMIQACYRLGITVMEKCFTLDDLKNADEIIVTSSSNFCLHACEVDGQPAGGKDPAMLKAIQDEVLREYFTYTGKTTVVD